MDALFVPQPTDSDADDSEHALSQGCTDNGSMRPALLNGLRDGDYSFAKSCRLMHIFQNCLSSRYKGMDT